MEKRAVSRRDFLRIGGGAGAGLLFIGQIGGQLFEVPVEAAPIAGGTLDPPSVPKYLTPLLIPPVMPRAGTVSMKGGKSVDYYEISMRQFAQQVLPPGQPETTVWGYGGKAAQSNRGVLIHHAPSLTIEAQYNRPVRVKWINELVDGDGGYLPHLLPVDPTLHWANPPGGNGGRDTRPDFDETPGPYTGPVPIVTHAHGAIGVGDESDGYAEAWYLPAASNIPTGFATEGRWYDFFAGKAARNYGAAWGPGFATFQYPNLGRAATTWYHDHALGMTRLNVYAGPAGFFIIRGGPSGDTAVLDRRTGRAAALPGPAPKEGDKFPPNKTYKEIPIAIQDRSFNADGSLFYPDTRTFFDGIEGPYLPDTDLSPIWNPEFFGNTMIVNGNTWPFQKVEQCRYRFRVLNGCQSRFLILDFSNIPGVEVWAIGNEGGFLAAPVNLTADNDNRLLMGLAERADLIVDFTKVPVGNYVLGNVGPDEPFGGGVHAAATTTSTPPTPSRPARSCSSKLCRQSASTPPLHRSSSGSPLSLHYRRRPSPDGSPCSKRCRCTSTAPPRPCSARWQTTPTAPPACGPRTNGCTRSRRTRRQAPSRSGSSTTPPPTPTRCTSTTSPSKWSTAKTSSWTRSPARWRSYMGRTRLRRNRGRPGSRKRSSPIPARSPGSGPSSTPQGSSSGTATSSNTKTTK